MTRKLMTATVAVALCLGGPAWAQSHAEHHPGSPAALADPARPANDVQRDAERKPAEMLAFAEVRPGQVVAELLPGGGYFTRLFARSVGPQGRVFAIITEAQAKAEKPPAVNALAAEPGYDNVTVVTADFTQIQLPQKADLVWTSQNYHDLHLPTRKLDVVAVNRSIYEALKPGGLYIVLDHAAAQGAGLETVDTLHRIDPAIVRREVEAAGFQYAGESAVLRNPADDHAAKVFDPAIRGRTDQFVYKFRKPG